MKIGLLIFFIKNLLECENFSARRLIISYQKLENTNIGRLSAKVANNRFDRTHCDD